MDRTINIRLAGHVEQYRLDEVAYDRLARYLDQAGSRLRIDPDRAETLADLERSVGDRPTALLGADDRLVAAADIDGVLEQIGVVGTGHDPSTSETGAPTRTRRLRRIRDEQKLAGVCAGLAAYAEWTSPGYVPCSYSPQSSPPASSGWSTSRTRSFCRSPRRAR